jgi:hypothetical protein
MAIGTDIALSVYQIVPEKPISAQEYHFQSKIKAGIIHARVEFQRNVDPERGSGIAEGQPQYHVQLDPAGIHPRQKSRVKLADRSAQA